MYHYNLLLSCVRACSHLHQPFQQLCICMSRFVVIQKQDITCTGLVTCAVCEHGSYRSDVATGLLFGVLDAMLGGTCMALDAYIDAS